MRSNDQYAEQTNQVNGGGNLPARLEPLVAGVAHAVGVQYGQQPSEGQQMARLPGAPQGAFDIPGTLAERVELCKLFADSDLVPRSLMGKPANLLLIMHKALALDIPLMVAIEHLHVIDNKVGHSAELLRARVAQAGHVLRWPTITDKEVVGELVLRHDPRHPRTERFTIADATRMKLTSKDNWSKDPASMMVARVTTRLVSRNCPEIAVGLGNLSAIDFEDSAPSAALAVAEPEVPPTVQAAELWALALDAKTSDELNAIGAKARKQGLLEVLVGQVPLQQRLMKCISDLAVARAAAAAAPATEAGTKAAKG